jgi:NAD(P)H-dependent FMN reductase
MTTPRILVFAGSARSASLNKRLAAVAARAVQAAGAQATLLDLRDYELPLYDGDLEQRGLPPKLAELKALFKAHHGLLLACPEYNGSITPLLKNTLDWVSRPAPGEKPLECYEGKVAGLVAASAGALGGLRGLVHVRAILGGIRVLVVPEQAAIGGANKAFDEQGELVDEKQRASVSAVANAVVRLSAKLIA